MQTCSHCGHQNPNGVHLCMNCAARFDQSCPTCGQTVPSGFSFCGHCGAKIEAERVPAAAKAESDQATRNEKMLRSLQNRMPSQLTSKFSAVSPDLVGQRREVTVMSIDLSGITKNPQGRSNEDSFVLIDRLIQLAVDLVYQYEGTIDKVSNEGLMAIFGLPINHENDPERAVRAGLAIQESIQSPDNGYCPPEGEALDVRIGINTGYVIAGKLGSEFHMEYTVIGDTLKVASSLVKAAKPADVLISFRTYQRARPIFKFETLPLIHLPDSEKAIKAYQPRRPRARPGRTRGIPGLRAPMVGRQSKIEILNQALQQVLDRGSSQFVAISGDAGLGKSRLISEFSSQLKHRQIHVYQGSCQSYIRESPYRVIAEMIRDIIKVSDVDPEHRQHRKLQEYLANLSLDVHEVFPYLLHVMGLPQADPLVQTRISLVNPDILQRQIHTALRSFLLAQIKLTPVLLIIEDFHWIDPASRDFLEFFVSGLDDVPMMMALISREFDTHIFSESISKAMESQKRLTRIPLQPLSEGEARHLLDKLIPDTSDPINHLKQEITRRAVGNPFYIEEIVRTLIEQDGLVRKQEAWTATELAPSLVRDVPGTLQDIIVARFDRLSEDLRQILQKATVLGDSSAVNLLRELVPAAQKDLSERLQTLETKDFIVLSRVDRQEIIGFKHPLIQETIYRTILKRDLRRIHSQVAKSIESGAYWLPDEKSLILAHHYAEGIEPAKAVPHLLSAAEKASQQFANETAVNCFRRAIGLMNTIPDHAFDITQLAGARIGLGKTLKFLGDFEEGTRVLQEAMQLVHDASGNPAQSEGPPLEMQLNALLELADIRAREGQLDLAGQVLETGINLLGPAGYKRYPGEWRRLSDRTAWVYFRQSKLEEAFKIADLALMNTGLRDMEDPITLANLNNTLGGIYWQWSKQKEAVDHVRRSLEIYQDLNYHWGMAIAYTNLGILNYGQGKWKEAVANFEQADELRQAYGYIAERPTNLKNLGELYIYLGELSLAREKLEKSRELSLQIGMSLAAAYAEIGLCRLAIVQDKYQQASLHLQSAKGLLPEDQSDDRAIQITYLEALIASETGDLNWGIELAHQALKLADAGGFLEEKKESLRVLSILSRQIHDFDQAEIYLGQCLELAQQGADDYRLAQAYFEYGSLHRTHALAEPGSEDGLNQQAYQAYNHALQIFEALGARHDLQLTKAALQELSAELAPQNGSFPTGRLEGELQSSKPATPSGERYRAAVLQMVLKRVEEADDELIFETLSLILPSLSEIVRENEGQIIRKRDSLTLVFGAPVTHEDDLERAIETAIEMSNFFQNLQSQTQLPFSIHFGLSTGTIIGGYVGPEEAGNFIVSGEIVQEAQRLARRAAPAKIWASAAVRTSTAHRYVYSAVEPDSGSGLAEHSLFQLEGLRDQILPVRGLIGIRTPLVGRKQELDAMTRLSENLHLNTGGIIWIEGEPGIGKSRLMREFVEAVEFSEVRVWSGKCQARRAERAFSLFSDLLLDAFDLQANLTNEEMAVRVEQKLEKLSPELMDIRPYLQMLLGIADSHPQGNQLAALEPEQLQRQTFVALRRLVEQAAQEQPLILLLDDLQWIDPISGDLIFFLSSLILANPVLIIVTQRAAEFSEANSVLARLQSMHVEQTLMLSIRPFTAQECTEFLGAVIPDSDLPEQLLSLIIQQSGGNPYYIEEFLRMMVEKEYLRVQKGKLVLNMPFELDAIAIPTSLELLIRARVDSLPASAKKLLQIASVIGQQFQTALLEKVSRQIRVDDILALLAERGMVMSVGDQGLWLFSHSLIENIVYYTLLKTNRRSLHLRIAELIESEFRKDENEFVEELAYHFDRAGENQRALKYIILAGERSAAQYANEEALVHFTKAAEILKDLPEVNDYLRWRVAVSLGEIYQFIGNFEASLIALRAELDLIGSSELNRAQQAGLYRRMGETLHKKGNQDAAISHLRKALEILETPQSRIEQDEAARSLARLGWSYSHLGDLTQARDAGLQALAMAEASDGLNVIAMAENLLGGLYYRLGEFAEAIKHTNRAMKSWEQIGYDWGVAVAHSNIGILEVAAGNSSGAYANFRRSLQLRQQMGDVEGVAITNNNLGKLACETGDLVLAEGYFQDSLAVAKPFQMAWQIANSSVGLAQTLLYRGDLEGAEKAMEEGFRLGKKIEARETLIELKIIKAEIRRDQGSLDSAIDLATQAGHAAGEIGNRQLASSSWRIAADCLLRQGKAELADQTLQKSWENLSGGGEKLETGRVHALAAEIARQLGDAKQTDHHLASAEQIFSKLGAARDLEHIRVG